MLFDLMYVKMAFNINIKKNSRYKPNWKLQILMLNKAAKILIGKKKKLIWMPTNLGQFLLH